MRKVASLFFAFCILNLSLGCSSAKVYTISDLKSNIKSDSYLILHTPTTRYKLTNYNFKDDKLEGELLKFKSKNGTYYHIYTEADFWGKLDKSQSLNFQLYIDSIYNIEQRTTDSLRTGLIITGVVLVAFVGIAAISLQSMEINMGGGI